MSETPSTHTLHVDRTIKAPPERVFNAWLDADLAARWFGPSDDHPCTEIEIDARVGGRYRFAFAPEDGGDEPAVVAGEYLVIDRHTLLVYTWSWATPGWSGRDSEVRIDFVPEGDATRIKLTHSGLLDDEALRAHRQGWDGAFDRLEREAPDF